MPRRFQNHHPLIGWILPSAGRPDQRARGAYALRDSPGISNDLLAGRGDRLAACALARVCVIFIKHEQHLASDVIKYRNDFGTEYETFCKTFSEVRRLPWRAA